MNCCVRYCRPYFNGDFRFWFFIRTPNSQHIFATLDRWEHQLYPRRTIRSVSSPLVRVREISIHDNVFIIYEWASVQHAPLLVSRQSNCGSGLNRKAANYRSDGMFTERDGTKIIDRFSKSATRRMQTRIDRWTKQTRTKGRTSFGGGERSMRLPNPRF